jgi:hypothetical protein
MTFPKIDITVHSKTRWTFPKGILCQILEKIIFGEKFPNVQNTFQFGGTVFLGPFSSRDFLRKTFCCFYWKEGAFFAKYFFPQCIWPGKKTSFARFLDFFPKNLI